MKINQSIAIAATALAVLSGSSPALAAGFTVSADKSTNLTIAGDTVTVSLTDLPIDTGVYVRLCQGTLAEVAAARPANCFGTGVWASISAASLAQGATDASKPIALPVQAVFSAGANSVDCTKVACGIHIRRDHMGGATDYSLDRFIPVTFGPAGTASAKLTAKSLVIATSGLEGKSIRIQYSNKVVVRTVASATGKYVFSLATKFKSLHVVITSGASKLFDKVIK
ncbi:MAG: hypothetical protein ACKOWJ_00600 [Micrococcales bacterium]